MTTYQVYIDLCMLGMTTYTSYFFLR